MCETRSTEPAEIGGYRKPLLAGHEAVLRELTEAKPGITLAELQRRLGERGIEGGCQEFRVRADRLSLIRP